MTHQLLSQNHTIYLLSQKNQSYHLLHLLNLIQSQLSPIIILLIQALLFRPVDRKRHIQNIQLQIPLLLLHNLRHRLPLLTSTFIIISMALLPVPSKYFSSVVKGISHSNGTSKSQILYPHRILLSPAISRMEWVARRYVSLIIEARGGRQ